VIKPNERYLRHGKRGIGDWGVGGRPFQVGVGSDFGDPGGVHVWSLSMFSGMVENGYLQTAANSAFLQKQLNCPRRRNPSHSKKVLNSSLFCVPSLVEGGRLDRDRTATMRSGRIPCAVSAH
jgi:hypothetical protein